MASATLTFTLTPTSSFTFTPTATWTPTHTATPTKKVICPATAVPATPACCCDNKVIVITIVVAASQVPSQQTYDLSKDPWFYPLICLGGLGLLIVILLVIGIASLRSTKSNRQPPTQHV
jgi:hypothetical protein